MKDTGGPAFPKQGRTWDNGRENVHEEEQEGMTLRDYFAAKAMPGFLKMLNACETETYRIAAIASYKAADAMLAEMNKA